jgi:hypothetical protein
MSFVANAALCLGLAAAVLGGIALFWIARQDESRNGRLIGLLAVALGVVAFLYLALGHHWL